MSAKGKTITSYGREYRVVEGPALAVSSGMPDYPREMMATYDACGICWETITEGTQVYELDNGRPAHARCAEDQSRWLEAETEAQS